MAPPRPSGRLLSRETISLRPYVRLGSPCQGPRARVRVHPKPARSVPVRHYRGTRPCRADPWSYNNRPHPSSLRRYGRHARSSGLDSRTNCKLNSIFESVAFQYSQAGSEQCTTWHACSAHAPTRRNSAWTAGTERRKSVLMGLCYSLQSFRLPDLDTANMERRVGGRRIIKDGCVEWHAAACELIAQFGHCCHPQ